VPGNYPARLATRILCIALWWTTLASSAPPQQDLPATPNAAVKADSVNVYQEMRLSSPVVSRLNKGDAVVVDYVFKSATENWCSVRRPAEKVRLGYAQCAELDRQERRAFYSTAGQGSNADARGKDPSTTPKTAKRSLNNLPITAPSVRSANGYEQMAALIVHDGAIDVVKLEELDSAALNGSPAAMGRAALGHYVAGNFELSRESSDEAVEQFNTATGFATKQPNLLLLSLLSLAYVQLRHSEYSAALEYLQRAHRVAPNSLWVAQLSGWAYYGLDRKDEAITQWQLAQRIRPSPEVADLLGKAERDKETESEFREGETHHFLLHYQGNATPQLAADVLRTLEEHFRTLQSELRVTPEEPIAVVLYTRETFRDVTRAPGWADGANDGRIRVPVQGMSSVSDQLSRILMHELTHSFIRQKTQGRCPQWLDEGLAQWMEGIRSESTAPLLVAAYEQGRSPALKQLEGSWTGFSGRHAFFAYAWSLAAVESIIANSSMWGIERLLGSLSAGSSVESAVGSALQTNYADLDRSVADYLRKNYGPPSP
jgi:tetratricopeptide (TPR) repeat protein